MKIFNIELTKEELIAILDWYGTAKTEGQVGNFDDVLADKLYELSKSKLEKALK